MKQTIETIIATIMVPGVAVAYLPYLILSGSDIGWPPGIGFLQLFSIFGITIGLGMVCWVSYAFVSTGKGTPIPVDPPTHFVVSGIFRYVRNPMYFGALLILVSEALFFSSKWLVLYASFLWLALHIFIVVFEEPQLAKRFGESYRAYLVSTPRWLPRIPHKHQ